MLSRSKVAKHFLGGATLVVFALVARILKFSPIIGSYCSFFSFADVGLPVLGAFGIIPAGIGIFSRIGWRMFVLEIPLSIKAFYLPSFCAAYYWSYYQSTEHPLRAPIFAFLVPLFCTILFITHPVGNSAALYTIYWLIPMALQVLPDRFLNYIPADVKAAVTSTFIAHAVGSVLWLYMTPTMTADQWLSLLPVVPLERFCFAAMMVVMYQVVQEIRQKLYGLLEERCEQ